MRLPLAMPIALACAATGCVAQIPGVFEWEEFEDRSTGSALPAAPPPPAFRGTVDIQARELGAAVAPALAAPAHGATGLTPLRTDGAIGITVTNYFAFRVLGAASYGSAALIGTPSVPMTDRPPLVGGVGFVFGWWGDRDWSLSLELDAQLALLASRDRYAVVLGHCVNAIEPFGGDGMSCSGGTPTGDHRAYQGYFGMPTFGTTLDFAGYVAPWLRLGASMSLQMMITRGNAPTASWQPAGVARAFVELHFEDVWLGIEVQEPFAEGVSFLPSVAGTLGGSLGPRLNAESHPPSRSPPAAWHAVVSERSR